MVVSASIFARITTTRISRHNAIKRIVLPKFIFPNRYSSYSCFMLLHSENVLQTSFMFSHTEIRIIYQNNVYKDDCSNEAADAATHFEKHCKFLRTPSWLYQNNILQEDIRLPAFIKLYKMCTLLRLQNVSIYAKYRC